MSVMDPALWTALGQHLVLTALSVGTATAVGIPLGVHLWRERWLAAPVLALLSAIQTVPSLALLGFLIPLTGVGAKPALLALFTYALLPVVRNTHAGLSQLDPAVLEAARGVGMREHQVLWCVALPLSLPVLLAGVRTSAVLSVGIATVAALVGAGGLGTFIFQGIAMVNTAMILKGAVPAAALALLLDGALGLAQRALTPRGLRGSAS